MSDRISVCKCGRIIVAPSINSLPCFPTIVFPLLLQSDKLISQNLKSADARVDASMSMLLSDRDLFQTLAGWKEEWLGFSIAVVMDGETGRTTDLTKSWTWSGLRNIKLNANLHPGQSCGSTAGTGWGLSASGAGVDRPNPLYRFQTLIGRGPCALACKGSLTRPKPK